MANDNAKQNGGRAAYARGSDSCSSQIGLTKREYFAAHVLSGMLAVKYTTKDFPNSDSITPAIVQDHVVTSAVSLTDKLLIELERSSNA